MDNLTKIQKNRIIIGGLVALLFIFGLGLWLFKYFEVLSDMNQTVSLNPLNKKISQSKQVEADLAKLEADYLKQSQALIDQFLAQASTQGVDLTVLANDYQTKMLALKLPVRYKESHLAQVLILGEIAELAQDGQASRALKKIENLRDFKVEIAELSLD